METDIKRQKHLARYTFGGNWNWWKWKLVETEINGNGNWWK